MNYKGFVLLEFEDWKKNFLDGREVEVETEIDDEYDDKYDEAFADYKSEIFESVWEEFFYYGDEDLPNRDLGCNDYAVTTCKKCNVLGYCEFNEELVERVSENYRYELDSIEEEKEVFYILDEDGDQVEIDFDYEYERQISEDKDNIDKYVTKGVVR